VFEFLEGDFRGIDAGATETVEDYASAVVLLACYLFEIAGSVVGATTVLVVNHHAGGTVTDPSFVDVDMASCSAKFRHVLVVCSSACFLCRSVRRVAFLNLIDTSP